MVTSLESLIDNSHGVAGLHLNGDVAPWGELTQGGRFEEWLTALDNARTQLDALASIEIAEIRETELHESREEFYK